MGLWFASAAEHFGAGVTITLRSCQILSAGIKRPAVTSCPPQGKTARNVAWIGASELG